MPPEPGSCPETGHCRGTLTTFVDASPPRISGGPHSPIHTSPNWPAPSRSTSFSVSLGTSHSSSHHGFWGFWVWQGRLNLVHSPSEESVRTREEGKAVNKAGLGVGAHGWGPTQSPPGEMDGQGRCVELSPDPWGSKVPHLTRCGAMKEHTERWVEGTPRGTGGGRLIGHRV